MDKLTPIRLFGGSDPYYYEVDNIPLIDLQDNDEILEDYLYEVSSNVGFSLLESSLLSMSSTSYENLLDTFVPNTFYTENELFDGNHGGDTLCEVVPITDVSVSSTIEKMVLRSNTSIDGVEHLLADYAKITEIDNFVVLDPVNVLAGITGSPNSPNSNNPFSTDVDLVGIFPPSLSQALSAGESNPDWVQDPFSKTNYVATTYDELGLYYMPVADNTGQSSDGLPTWIFKMRGVVDSTTTETLDLYLSNLTPTVPGQSIVQMEVPEFLEVTVIVGHGGKLHTSYLLGGEIIVTSPSDINTELYRVGAKYSTVLSWAHGKSSSTAYLPVYFDTSNNAFVRITGELTRTPSSSSSTYGDTEYLHVFPVAVWGF